MGADTEARLRALFQQHHAAVRRYALYRAIRGADADDLVNEVFTVAWRRLGDVPTDDALPWLLAVAHYVRRNQARSARRNDALRLVLPRPDDVPPPREPDVDADRLRQAFVHLSPDDQEVLRLLAWDDLTPRQIAVVLGCPDGTARARLHRARRRLAERLANFEGDGDDEDDAGNAGNGGSAGRSSGQFVAEITRPQEGQP
jgi:RNA polymerase sigma factor (sigma-70 family)